LRRERDFRFVEADLSSANLSIALQGVECVFHLAAQPGVRASWGKSFSHYVKDNIVATQRLLEALKQHSLTKFVYASSSSIYGDSERLPTPEDTLPKPVSPYGVTKLSGENLCNVYHKNYSVPVVSLRYFTVYGPRQRPDMAFNVFISRISRGEQIELYGDGEQRRDFTFVDDTVAANLLASKANPGETYNVGSGRTYGMNEVISAIESVVGKKAKVRRSGKALGDVRSTAADITKITRDLGYVPSTTLLDGLERQVEAQIGPRTA
ncbi:MAG: NAD-dependent epimerase/dehydratase family protein, partial [Nitrososphaerales archaeon]